MQNISTYITILYRTVILVNNLILFLARDGILRIISRITRTAHANRVLNRVPYAPVLFVCAVPYSMAWAFCRLGFSACKRLLCGAGAASTRASGEKKIGTTMDLVVEVLVVMLVVVVLVTLPMLMVIVFVVFVIFGFRKNIGMGLDDW